MAWTSKALELFIHKSLQCVAHLHAISFGTVDEGTLTLDFAEFETEKPSPCPAFIVTFVRRGIAFTVLFIIFILCKLYRYQRQVRLIYDFRV